MKNKTKCEPKPGFLHWKETYLVSQDIYSGIFKFCIIEIWGNIHMLRISEDGELKIMIQCTMIDDTWGT